MELKKKKNTASLNNFSQTLSLPFRHKLCMYQCTSARTHTCGTQRKSKPSGLIVVIEHNDNMNDTSKAWAKTHVTEKQCWKDSPSERTTLEHSDRCNKKYQTRTKKRGFTTGDANRHVINETVSVCFLEPNKQISVYTSMLQSDQTSMS